MPVNANHASSTTLNFQQKEIQPKWFGNTSIEKAACEINQNCSQWKCCQHGRATIQPKIMHAGATPQCRQTETGPRPDMATLRLKLQMQEPPYASSIRHAVRMAQRQIAKSPACRNRLRTPADEKTANWPSNSSPENHVCIP